MRHFLRYTRWWPHDIDLSPRIRANRGVVAPGLADGETTPPCIRPKAQAWPNVLPGTVSWFVPGMGADRFRSGCHHDGPRPLELASNSNRRVSRQTKSASNSNRQFPQRLELEANSNGMVLGGDTWSSNSKFKRPRAAMHTNRPKDIWWPTNSVPQTAIVRCATQHAQFARCARDSEYCHVHYAAALASAATDSCQAAESRNAHQPAQRHMPWNKREADPTI